MSRKYQGGHTLCRLLAKLFSASFRIIVVLSFILLQAPPLSVQAQNSLPAPRMQEAEETETPEDPAQPTEPSETIEPSGVPEGSNTPEVSDTPEPTETPESSETPEGSDTPEVSETPEISETPLLTETVESLDAGIFSDCSAVQGIPEGECNALTALYSATDGVNWMVNTDWLSSNMACSWFGVTCDEAQEHVVRLNLVENNLAGPIPPSIADLDYLTELTLSKNALTGEIPAEVWTMTTLERLDLWTNQLTGELPAAIGDLIHLTYIDLDDNQLSGAIPVEIGLLTNLEYLWLSSNQFEGEIPDVLGSLTNLEALGLGDNYLTGSIPASLGDLVNLRELYLYDNILSGTIPIDLGDLPALEVLYLYRNYLEGAIPSQFNKLTNLEYLDLSDNLLTGSIPDLRALTKLELLVLSSNGLTGNIPTWMGLLTSLRMLHLGYNDLEGAGGVPGNFRYLVNLEEFTINNNPRLTGTLATAVTSMVNLSYFDMTMTGLCLHPNSVVRDWIGGIEEAYITTFCSDYEFTSCAETMMEQSECNALLTFATSTKYQDWTQKTGWKQNNSPCTWYGVTCTNGYVTSIYLPSNNLGGSLPSVIEKFTYLQTLNLPDNNIGGSIPGSIKNLEYINYLNLSGNNIAGSIPTGIGNLDTLIYLDLSNNKLTGSIPSGIVNLSSLYYLYLQNNKLAGSIPVNIGNLTSLRRLLLYKNQLTGSIPSSIGSLANLEILALGENKLTGGIPPQIGHLDKLINLSLWKNQFSGSVPPEIGDMDSLLSLDLATNPSLNANLPLTLMNLDLENFFFDNTGVCMPSAPTFQSWIARIPSKSVTQYCDGFATLVSLSPAYAFRNDPALTITVNGENFQTNSVVRFDGFDLDTTFISATKLTAAVPVELLSEWEQDHEVTVFTEDMTVQETASRVFTVIYYVPEENWRNNMSTVTFGWEPVAGAVQYNIQLSLSSNFSTKVFDKTFAPRGENGWYYTTTLTNRKTYYWRMRVKIGSAWGPWTSAGKFYSMNPPKAPSLVYPADKAYISDSTPELSWNAVDGGYRYEVNFSISSTFSRASGVDTIIQPMGDGETTFLINDGLPDGKYYWRVRSADDISTMSGWSAPRSFTIDTVPPAMPNLNTPKADSFTADTTPALSVKAASGASGYIFQLSATDDFSTVLWESPASGLTASPAAAFAQPYGVYYWRSKSIDKAGNESGWSATPRKLTITILKSPVNAAITTDTTPTFSWNAVSGASGYLLTITGSDVDYSYSKQLGKTTTFTLPFDYQLPIGNYTWQMCILPCTDPAKTTPSWAFKISPAKLSAPAIESPKSTDYISDTTPTFKWKTVFNAMRYEIQVDNNSKFTSPEFEQVLDHEKTLENTMEITLSEALPDGKYYWRMRTFNQVDVAGSWSSTRTLTIDTIPPAAPVLSTPKDFAFTTDSTPSLTVKAVSGATKYEFQLDVGEDFSNPQNRAPSSALTWTVPNLLPNHGYTRYFWRVKAIDAAGNMSEWSSVYHFSLSIVKTPADNSYTTDTTPQFTWNAFKGAKSYELRIYNEGESDPRYTSPVLTSKTVSFTLPNLNKLDAGKYSWRLVVTNSAGNPVEIPLAHLTISPPLVNVPLLADPVTGFATKNRRPTFIWNALVYPDPQEALGYEFMLDNNSDFSSPVYKIRLDAQEDAETYQVTLPSDLKDGKYFWRVRAVNYLNVPDKWCAARAITIDNVPPPGAPKLISYQSGYIIYGVPTFTWKAVSGAVAYQFQRMYYENGWHETSTITLTTLSYTPVNETNDAPVYEYGWRVRACDAAANCGAWSPVNSISVYPAVPQAPALISPTNDSTNADNPPVFRWHGVTYGIDYEIQVSNTRTFAAGTIIENEVCYRCAAFAPSDALHEGIWFWRVRAINYFDKKSPWSAVWSVTIE